jgi:hypothetical protein
VANIYLFRRKTAADWTAANPVLMSGELGLETDTTRFKFGNGSTAWNSLAYAGASVGIVPWGSITGTIGSQADLMALFAAKQATLVSATNIKTINGASILGAGDLAVSGGGSATWGGITGTLSAQTDLQTALNAKANVAGQVFTGAISATNLSGTNTGDQTITLTGDVTGSGTGSFAATIGAGAVTYAKMQATALGNVVLGKAGAAGTVTEIQLGTNQFLGRGGANITPIGIDSTLTITGSTLGVTSGTYVTVSGFDAAVAATPAVTANTAKVTNATHTGDATGDTALTLATVNGNVGAFGSATQVATFTVNAKGLTTAAANVAISIPASQVSDFPEAVDDRVATLLVAGANITLTYNDVANTLTVASTGGGGGGLTLGQAYAAARGIFFT